MKALLTVLCCLVTLTGCQLTRIEGKVDGVDVKASTSKSSTDDKFCPPGQAKKGKC